MLVASKKSNTLLKKLEILIFMDMSKENISYQCAETSCTGYFASENSSAKRPLVLILPTWYGVNDFAREWAHEMAAQGYAAFVCDVYGDGRCAKNDTEAAELMGPYYMDRGLLRSRLLAAYEAGVKRPEVDQAKVGVMGFCFGGLAAIELLRSGANLQATICVHAVINDEYNGKSVAIPHGGPLQGSLLILTGAKDPMAPRSGLEAVQKEMTEASVDWQTHIFGNAAHSFTNKEAANLKAGMYYEALSAQRSSQLIKQFFKERFA
jgi:dienelactone hydrolase